MAASFPNDVRSKKGANHLRACVEVGYVRYMVWKLLEEAGKYMLEIKLSIELPTELIWASVTDSLPLNELNSDPSHHPGKLLCQDPPDRPICLLGHHLRVWH